MSAPGRTAETGSWIERHARVLPWASWALVLLLALSPIVAPAESQPDESTASETVAIVSFYIFMLSMSTVGAFVATRRPSNPLPWIMLFAGFWYAVAAFSDSYGRALDDGGSLTGVLAFISSVSWLLALAPVGTYLLLLFPDGHLLSPRWKVIAWTSFIGIFLFVVGTAITPGPLEDIGGDIESPFGIPGAKAVGQAMVEIGFLAMLASVLSSIASIVLRYRRSRADTRQQMKWLVFGVAMIGVAIVTSFVLEGVFKSESAINFSNGIITVAFSLIPISIGISVLKYRLYDIDVVINKTIVFGVLAAFITAVYVAIVVGIGTLLGSQNDPNLALSIAATAVVAIAFSPVKERTQRVANRLVYGHRLSPYEVLTELSRTVATAPTPNDVLRGVAHAACVGVNAASATVTLDLGGKDSIVTTYPQGLAPEAEAERMEVRHKQETLGEIAIHKRAADPITPHDNALLRDLASQAGIALHNARLALELQARLDEISAQADDLLSSRARIVSAADDSRRSLERDISEGPRRDLVSMREELEGVRATMQQDPESAATAIEPLTEEANHTLDALRELARGIYPPLLADKGLVSAVGAHVRKHNLPVTLETNGVIESARFEQATESSMYFCCIELLKNPGPSVLRLGLEDQSITIRMESEEINDATYVALNDRIDAVGGELSVNRSAVEITMPAAAEELVS